MADNPVRRKREKVSPQEALTRGLAAQTELRMLEEAFEQYASVLFANWVSTHPEETEKRERMYYALQAIGGARTALISIINDGHAVEANELIAATLGARN